MVTIRSLRDLAKKEASFVENALKDMEENLIDPGYTLELTKSIHRSSRNIDDFIKKNTEILLNEHATVVRQNVIQKMKNQIKDMNDEMSQDAKKLGDDISNFFEFIQTSYTLASDSFKKVTELAKKNYENVELITMTEDKIFSLKKVMQKNSKYEKTPVDVSNVSSNDVLKMVRRLKESNLSLVYNSRFSQGSSTFQNTEILTVRNKMNEELAAWDEKIAISENELEMMKDLNEKLKKQSRDLEDEEKERNEEYKEELKKLNEIYKVCTGSEVQVADPVLMRVAIDHTIQGILFEINTYPRKKVKELIKTLEAEKKLSERKAEEALRAQRATERLKKALSPAAKKELKKKKKPK
ncbi:uncharacterized protein CDAR_592321 [Caerostris darwini]|uniref:Uncharacterized protein n=1 Tax=Caerostris darwini TaxID=1538125 RepID=A0AAV4X8W4_9ARAC|nr:uncharacterized protein CDAR_592321 [Caerostris darwini]